MFIRMCYRRPDGHCLGLFCIYNIFFHNKKNISICRKVRIIELLTVGMKPIISILLLLSPSWFVYSLQHRASNTLSLNKLIKRGAII
jgi:hypothetical protein